MVLTSVNPATGEVVAEYDVHDAPDVDTRLHRADAAFPPWRDRGLDARGEVLTAVADVLEGDPDRFARLATTEMGKPIRDAREEVGECARALRFAAAHAAHALAAHDVADATRVTYAPLGAVLGVMPWNNPYWQVVRFAAPALMAGNPVLVKHASNVTGCLLALEAAFTDAGADAAFQALLLPADRVADVVRDHRVRGVSVTGSDTAGPAVARAAGDVVKPVVLELGGSDPFIVLEDADAAAVAREAARARCVNAGQSGIAAKRFIVHDDVRNEFLDAFVAAMEGLRVGDPMDEATDVGPLARADLRDAVHAQVARTVDEGARVLTGGTIPDGPGAYYPPTVLTDVHAGMPVLAEEVLGPVAPVLPFEDDEAVVRLANATPYGLGASVWTRDPERGRRLAGHIEAGTVSVNAVVRSDPGAPFGGVKRSGHGRELGAEGFRAFTNVKTVVVRSPEEA